MVGGLFVVLGIQNGGRCICYDTVYCCENSEECAEKGMTQNSKHNRFLSALAAPNADSSSSMLPYSHGGFSCPRACWVCVCVFWAGVAWSLFIPGSQLTHEVMVVTLSVDPFCPPLLIHRCDRSVDDGERWYVAMCLEPSPLHALL